MYSAGLTAVLAVSGLGMGLQTDPLRSLALLLTWITADSHINF